MDGCKKKWQRTGAMVLMFLLAVQVIFGDVGNLTVQAAKKDKTKPRVVLYLNKTAYTRGSVYIQVRASDASGIRSILIKKGSISKSASKYWKSASNITKSKKKKVTSNATYSVRVEDKAGNVTIKRIAVTNIDKKKPSITLSQTVVSGGMQVTVKASDASGIKSVKWLKGGIDNPGSSKFNKAKNITKERRFTVTSNGLYTVQVVDKAGNKAVKQIQVTVRQALYDLDDYYWNISDSERHSVVTDSLNKSYTNALCLYCHRTERELTYYLAGEYQYIEGDFACYASKTDPAILQIYQDDELVYTSSTVYPETGAIHFKVDIQNARFIKIKILSDDWYNYYIIGNCYLYN